MSKAKPIVFITTFSRYESIQILGEGGSGFVYEVKDEDEKRFAIKLLKTQNVTHDRRKRFQNEITFCEHFSHRNIISVKDHGVKLEDDKEAPFYVMDLYDSSLRSLIKTNLNPNSIIGLFGQLLDGIEAAHLQGIFHRDLKPENILYKADEARLAIADFGIARFTEEELYTAVETNIQDRLANFQYAAPEQRRRGRVVDSRADIYAVGLILNEMFTHEIPQGTGFKTISSVSPEYSYLDEVIEKMIRQNPDERISSIKKVKKILKGLGANFVSEQKLSHYKSEVIPISEIDDPLVVNPIVIEDFEWDNNNLTLILNQQVNSRWINAFHNMGNFSSVQGHRPNTFTFNGNKIKTQAREEVVQPIINIFKSWIPRATRKYEQTLKDEQHRREEHAREEQRKNIEQEEAKARLRNNIKL